MGKKPDFKKLQKQVEEYDRQYGWDKDDAAHIVVHMTEELGEIGRCVLKSEGYKKEEFDLEHLGQELTDLMYLNLKLANKFNIELEGEWNRMWRRYEKKNK